MKLQAALGIAGAGAVTYGAGLIYAPAGWIVGGLFLLLAFTATLMEKK